MPKVLYLIPEELLSPNSLKVVSIHDDTGRIPYIPASLLSDAEMERDGEKERFDAMCRACDRESPIAYSRIMPLVFGGVSRATLLSALCDTTEALSTAEKDLERAREMLSTARPVIELGLFPDPSQAVVAEKLVPAIVEFLEGSKP